MELLICLQSCELRYSLLPGCSATALPAAAKTPQQRAERELGEADTPAEQILTSVQSYNYLLCRHVQTAHDGEWDRQPART